MGWNKQCIMCFSRTNLFTRSMIYLGTILNIFSFSFLLIHRFDPLVGSFPEGAAFPFRHLGTKSYFLGKMKLKETTHEGS